MNTLQEFLHRDNQRKYADEIEESITQGIHTHGIAKIEIEGEASQEFMRYIMENNAAQKGKSSRNDKVLMQYAQDLDLIGVWGQRYMINGRDGYVLEELKKNGIKLFILDQDDSISNITDCNSLELLEEYR